VPQDHDIWQRLDDLQPLVDDMDDTLTRIIRGYRGLKPS
jgi:hypothetical protein